MLVEDLCCLIYMNEQLLSFPPLSYPIHQTCHVILALARLLVVDGDEISNRIPYSV